MKINLKLYRWTTISLIALGFYVLYVVTASSGNLTFSDSAKFADAGRNLLEEGRLAVHHSFFSDSSLRNYIPGKTFEVNFTPVNSRLLSLVFLSLPTTDQTLIFTGGVFFIISALLLYELTQKLFSQKAGLVALLFFLTSPFFLEYGYNFTTEIIFTFEILMVVYVVFLLRPKWVWMMPILLIMYFTRPQALPFYASLVVFFAISYVRQNQFSFPRLINVLLLTGVVLLSLLLHTRGNLVTLLGSYSGSLYLPEIGGSSYLRGVASGIPWNQLPSKIAYNFVNFIKYPERLAAWGIFIFYAIFPFLKLNSVRRRLWLFSLISFLFFILTASLTLPNARYVHPVLPLIYICSAAALVSIIRQLKLKPGWLITFLMVSLILIKELSFLTIDGRYRRNQYNFGKPSAAYQISQSMAKVIPPGKLIITNLDAWPAWYAQLTTMWFPVNPKMLDGYLDKISYIALTNYNTDKADFSLGMWQEIFDRPEEISNDFISTNFHLVANNSISKLENFENLNYRLVILENNDISNN